MSYRKEKKKYFNLCRFAVIKLSSISSKMANIIYNVKMNILEFIFKKHLKKICWQALLTQMKMSIILAAVISETAELV